MPHRDVQSSPVDYEVSAHEIVQEYLNNPEEANEKYLSEDGDSKILLVDGTVASIEVDMNNQKVVLLKEEGDRAGVSCTFMENTNEHLDNTKPGDKIRVKGVIRSGAGYDADLEMYEDVIMEKSISNKLTIKKVKHEKNDPCTFSRCFFLALRF